MKVVMPIEFVRNGGMELKIGQMSIISHEIFCLVPPVVLNIYNK
jgi:hypothetical protein